MKICFIADARSPISKNWIAHFVRRGDEVHVISSYPCAPDEIPGAAVYPIPMYFSELSKVRHDGTVEGTHRNRRAVALLKPILVQMRTGFLARPLHTLLIQGLAPFEILRHVGAVRDLIRQIAPDLVHAMRIPFEAIVAAKATPVEFPLITSVWGNDFTLFAMRNYLIRTQTNQVLKRTDGLHCDCRRDLHIAQSWGFNGQRLSIVLPGAGGIHLDRFYPGAPDVMRQQEFGIPPGAPVVINPRGFRGYVRNDVFFKAMPQVLKQCPSAVFVCTGTQGNATAEKWTAQAGIESNVRLLPQLRHEQMADLFRLSQVSVSPSTHDGTPNTLLEAMACGCFPVAGDIESVREWITHGTNGLLCDPNNPEALAGVLIQALRDDALRQQAQDYNARMIRESAEYHTVMARAETFYTQVVEQKGR